MKTFVATVLLAVILAAPAYAQMGKGANTGDDKRVERAAKAEKERAGIEKEYDETMSRLRSKGPAPKTDPWGIVRPGTNAKP
jgi:hypothetical protein